MTQDDETEVLDQNPDEEVVEEPEVEEEQQEEGQEGEPSEGGETDEAADEVVVTIGDEPAVEEEIPEKAAPWIRDLRKKNQETVRENRELKKQLEALKAAPVEKAEVGEEPSLEACEYDEDKFKAEWKAWNQRQAERAEQERKKQEQGAKAQAEWQEKVAAYQKEKSELKISDADDAEATAFEVLDVTQRGILLDAVKKPALVAVALGKNPKRLAALAAIKNPIKFAIAVHDMEKEEMKVTPRKSAPLPETPVRGGARLAGGADARLDQLREKAAKTGDMSEVVAYKNQLKAQKRA